MTEPLGDHAPVGRLHAVHDAHQIDVDDVAPIIEPVIAYLAADGDTGVVEEIIESALSFDGERYDGVEGDGVAHIELHRFRLAPRGIDRGGDVARQLELTIGEKDARPRRASSRPSAAPIPDAPPVTIATASRKERRFRVPSSDMGRSLTPKDLDAEALLRQAHHPSS